MAMSAAPKILEGTWEDIAKHSRELAGHRLKVYVMDGEATPMVHPAFDTSPDAVRAWVEQIRRRGTEGPPIRLGDDSRDAIYEDFLT
jgi:hypothetical protein